jgi:hypothetical protein
MGGGGSRVVHGASFPWDELFSGRDVHEASTHGVSCSWASWPYVG